MVTRKYARLLEQIDRLPAPDRSAATRALTRIRAGRISRAASLDMVADLVAAATRSHAKRSSDRRTDHERRCLIGARLPRTAADRYRAAAAAQGVSLYRWVSDALEAAAAAQEKGGSSHQERP